MRLLLCACLALCAASARAEEPPEKTVVLGFVAKRGVDPGLAEALTEVILGPYSQHRGQGVISRADLLSLLDLEAQKQALGCDDGACISELASALDAGRIVSGTITKVGSSFLIVLNEYDSKEVKALGRVQEQVSGDESALVEAVTRLANQLLGAAPSTGNSGSGATASAGSLEVRTDPAGAEVFLAGEPKGTTPVRIDNLRTGKLPLKLIRKDYSTVQTEVPIYPGQTTTVAGHLRLDRALAEANHEVHLARFEEEKLNHSIWLYTKAGSGALLAGAGTLWFLNSLRPNVGPGERNAAVVGGLVVGGIGFGLGAWAVVDLGLAPQEPIPDWELERKIEITPPEDTGDEVVEVTLAASPASER